MGPTLFGKNHKLAEPEKPNSCLKLV
jgi:hypothetical protein